MKYYADGTIIWFMWKINKLDDYIFFLFKRLSSRSKLTTMIFITRMLLKKEFLEVNFKSSFLMFCSPHHHLVNRYVSSHLRSKRCSRWSLAFRVVFCRHLFVVWSLYYLLVDWPHLITPLVSSTAFWYNFDAALQFKMVANRGSGVVICKT